MKFLPVVLALFAATAEANRVSRSLVGRKVNKRKLMANAVKVDKNGHRQLDQEEGFQITEDYSLRFNTCMSLTTEPADEDAMFSDDVIGYTMGGQIVSQKSMVLFNVCETDYCSYAADDENLYMVDLATYMGSLINYYPEKEERYCEVCEEAQQWCLYDQYEEDEAEEEAEEEGDEADEEGEGDEEQDGEGEEQEGEEEGEEGEGEEDGEEDGEGEEGEEDGEGEEGEEDGGERRRRRRRLRKLENANNFEVVDCDVCAAKDCFVAENDGEQEEDEEEEIDVAAFVENMLACQASEVYWNNQLLYTGFMCNHDGSGVELAVFLDEDCSVYTSAKGYRSIMDEDDYDAYSMSETIATYPFKNAIDCAQEVEYITPEEYQEMQAEEEAEEEEDEDEEVAEANDYCQAVFGDDVRNLEDCDADGEEDEEEEEEEVEEEEDNEYDWYTYLLSQEDSEDPGAVCELIQSMEGEYTYVYNKDESGSSFNYNENNSLSKGSGGMSGAAVTAVVIGILIALLALACFVQSCFAPKKDSKRERLIPGKGAMA